MGYYSDSLGEQTKKRLSQHKEKGCRSFDSVVNKLLDYYEQQHNTTTDPKKILTKEEHEKYQSLKHGFERSEAAINEYWPHTELLDIKQMQREQDDYFKFRKELTQKYPQVKF